MEKVIVSKMFVVYALFIVIVLIVMVAVFHAEAVNLQNENARLQKELNTQTQRAYDMQALANILLEEIRVLESKQD